MTTKLFSSTMAGAPVLNGNIGSMINLLDAVLVNGFGLVTASAGAVASNVATLTFGVAHPFAVGSVALIAGATPASLNGEHRVVSMTATTITFAAVAADGAASGTITAMVASAGWAKQFTGTNTAAYKIADVTGTGCVLWVDDTATGAARVRGCESMSDINTGVGIFPSTAQYAAPGLWWSKSYTTGLATAWKIVADSRGFYYFVNSVGSNLQSNYFGDVQSLKSNDPYACVLRGNASSQIGTSGNMTDDLSYSDSSGGADGMYAARAANALGSSQKNNTATLSNIGLSMGHYTGSVGFPYPSAIDNGLMLGQVAVYSAAGIRGYMPGLYMSPQITNAAFSTGDVIAGSGAMAGKSVTAFNVGNSVLFIDSISNWR